MKLITLLFAAVLAAGALAGCADNTSDDSTSTPTVTTPATTPPTATTPTTTTPPVNTTDDGEEMPHAMDCPDTAASASANATPLMGYPQVTFTVKEPSATDPCFGFVGPASVAAGWTAVTLMNDGMQPHIMPMYQVTGSKTRDEIFAAITSENETPSWLTPVGGVGFATPFSSGTAIMDLKEGQYVAVCYFNGHFMQGMWRILNVTAAEGTPVAAPVANVTIELTDFNFTVPNLTAGLQIVAFHNAGAQPHEAPLVRLTGNATMMEFLNAVENAGPTSPPPPGTGIGGVNVLAPDATAYAIVDLTPGNYGMVCFVEDPASHAPHVALGMVAQFTVA